METMPLWILRVCRPVNQKLDEDEDDRHLGIRRWYHLNRGDFET